MNKLWIFIFFVCGVIFRFWIINLFPQELIYDQVQYVKYALSMVQYGLYADSFRIYGYPLFIAVIHFLTGGENAVKLVQVLLDATTAILVYLTAEKILKERKVAALAYILYLFNPFTAGFVGVLLPEILIIFLIALLFFLLSTFLEKINYWKLSILALLLGFIAQVRPFYIYFSFIVLAILVFLCLKNLLKIKNKLSGTLVLLAFFILPFLYNIAGNLKYFGEFAVMDVDNLFVENLYIGLFLERSPYIIFSIWDYPPEVRFTFETYSYSLDPKDKAGRNERKKLFLNLIYKEILKDPVKFIRWRVEKLWFVWEKHTIYPYTPEGNVLQSTFVYWTNVIVLLTSALGIFSFGKETLKSKGLSRQIIFITTLLIILNTFAVGAATSAQERYSLPAYPVLFIFCALGFQILAYNIAKKFNYKLSKKAQDF